MITRHASRGQVLAAFATVYLVWGSTYLAIRYAVGSLPPFLMAGARFLVAGAALYGCLRLRGAPRPDARAWGWSALAGLLLLGFGNGGVAWAETRVPSGIAALIVATVALWVVLLDWLRPAGRRPVPLVVAGVLVGLVGVGILVGPQRLGAAVDPLGATALVAASLSWAAGSLLARTPRMPRPPLVGAAMQMVTGGAWLTLFGLAGGEWARLDWSAVDRRSLVALGYLVCVGSLVAYPAYIWLVGHVAPARAATYAYVNPVVAVLLGWAVAGERVDARVVVASAVIVGAVALVTVGQSRSTPAAAPAAPAPRRKTA